MKPLDCWVVAGFLGGQREPLLDFVINKDVHFHPATVSLGATRSVIEGVRRAKILDSLCDWEGLFLGRLRQLLHPAIDRLGYKRFTPGRIELQATASNDGDYFRLHQDGGPDDTREITFVYFLHGEPRPFSGGELRIRSSTVEPHGDTIVLFPSSYVHEVMPVRVPSGAFVDSRFTVNGWIHGIR